jgi:stalled ribosome rescue protein Dom34
MKRNKCLAIWMDHSNAYLMDLRNDNIVTNIVISESMSQDVEFSSVKHEKLIHKKEQHQQLNYYKKLGDSIRNYQEVLLFGPTDAKKELLNLLKTDALFEKIKFELKNSDKMTESQRLAFVRDYLR